ncbi:MAG TPA: DUF1127 domain-containing protein [Nitrospira sp.]|nr:DUF1127 domain-containing protein [Nitrospira sp.]
MTESDIKRCAPPRALVSAFLLHQTANKIRLSERVTAWIIGTEIGTMSQQDRKMPSTAITEPTNLAHGITGRRQLRRDYLELSAMSDPELQDMGINRSDIFNVVEGTYRSAARSPISRQKQTPKRPLRWSTKSLTDQDDGQKGSNPSFTEGRTSMNIPIRPSNKRRQKQRALAAVDYSSSSLLPMLVSGLVLIVFGMIAVAIFSA